MKVENFSDEQVAAMAREVRLQEVTITKSQYDAMKARCALFDELAAVLKNSLPVLEGSLVDPIECAKRYAEACRAFRKAEKL